MNEVNNRLFILHGCDRKVGTSMIAHSIAKMMSDKLPDKKILMVSLNGNDDIHYSKNNGSSIESIKMKVDNNLLSVNDLETSCARDDKLYVLGGVSGTVEHRNYSPEFSLKLLEKSFEFFDIVVVDSGNELDCGLCVGTLKAGGIPVMIMCQNQSTLIRYKKIRKLYEAIGVDFLIHVINRYYDDDPNDISYIRSKLDLKDSEVFFTVKDERMFSRLAEIDEQIITEYRCPGFSEDIKDIVMEMLKTADVPEIKKDNIKRKFFGFM
ncbi:MAG: hypothetical protein E7228_07240 [Clostridiales bacterium]|nr:hypothetical protein [Clostridiales bacterium]